MNITNAELKNSLDLKVSQLEKEVEQHLPYHDEEYLRAITSGLQLKNTADLFTEEERALLGTIEKLQRESFFLLEQIQSEAVALIKAEKEAQGYESRIGEPIEVLRERNQQEHQDASDMVRRASNLASMAKANGWERYEEILTQDPTRALREAQAIIDSMTIIEAIKPLPNVDTTFQFPPALRVEIETDTYLQRVVHMTPLAFSELGKAEQFAIIDTMLSPLLYHHRKALEGNKQNTALLDSYIEQKRILLTSEPAVEVEPEQYTIPFPDTYFFPKDKISNSLTKLDSGVRTPVALESRAEKKKGTEITGYVLVNFDGMNEETSIDGVKISANAEKAIEPFEKLVVNAVFTVWINAMIAGEIQDGVAKTTLHQLYRIMTQNESSDPTEEMLLELKRILGKLATGYMELDVSEEQKHHKGMGDFAGRSGAFMQVVVDRKRVHGQMTDVVYISRLDLSPLYAYSNITNRIANVPMNQLQLKGTNIKKNKETMVVGDYLLSRIEAIPHISNTIVFDSLLESTGIYEADYKNWKDKKAKTLKKVLDILDGYKRTGLIKDYTINKRGRTKVYSITIKK